MKFKEFEIRPVKYLNDEINKQNKKFEIVKWHQYSEPIEVYVSETGKKEMRDGGLFVIAFLRWNEEECGFDFESVGTRYLEHYENGLNEFILGWIHLYEIMQEFENND